MGEQVCRLVSRDVSLNSDDDISSRTSSVLFLRAAALGKTIVLSMFSDRGWSPTTFFMSPLRALAFANISVPSRCSPILR